MAWTTLQVTLGTTATRISTANTQCRQIIFQNNAAAVMRLGDSTVSATNGISLAAAGAAGSTLSVGQMDVFSSYLSDFYVFGTSTQKIDIFFNT